MKAAVCTYIIVPGPAAPEPVPIFVYCAEVQESAASPVLTLLVAYCKLVSSTIAPAVSQPASELSSQVPASKFKSPVAIVTKSFV